MDFAIIRESHSARNEIEPVSNPISISSRKPVRPQSVITVFFWMFFILSRRKQGGDML